MPSIEIDLNARVLSTDHGVYVVRPGKGYRLYPDFVEESSIFPDLPGLQLEKGRALGTYDDLTERVAQARALRGWHRGGRGGERPSTLIADYRGARSDAGIGQLAGIVRGYFDRLKKGDLVIVPPSSYTFDSYIGELQDDSADFVQVKAPRWFGDDQIPARRVRWLARIPKRKLPLGLLKTLAKPNALFQLDRSLKPDIYDVAYGNYIIEDSFTARFDVSSDEFTVADDFTIQAFFKFVATNTRAIDLDDEGAVQGFREAAFFDAGDYVPSLETEIHSPGTLNLICRRLTPLVAAALLVAAIEVGPDAVHAAETGQIVLRNSKAPANDPCTARVQHHVIRHIQLLGLDRWPEACEKAQEAATKNGLKSPARVIRRP